MGNRTIRNDLEFLVNNPKKTLGSMYHDAGSCWLLIEEALKEIRKLRKLNVGLQNRPSPKSDVSAG